MHQTLKPGRDRHNPRIKNPNLMLRLFSLPQNARVQPPAEEAYEIHVMRGRYLKSDRFREFRYTGFGIPAEVS
jgi:hypothetical protein